MQSPAALIAASQPEAALAKGGAYGIWEGRIVSMAHPFVMAVLYGASAFAAFTGFQWRRLREIGGEITELKAELKGPKAAIAAAEEKGEAPSASLVSQAASLEAKIDELSATRKELAEGSFRDKHYQVLASLAARRGGAVVATVASRAHARTRQYVADVSVGV